MRLSPRDMIRKAIDATRPGEAIHAYFRRLQQENGYRRARDHYAAVAPKTGQAPPFHGKKAIGAIHTFAVVPGWSWHDELLPDLEKLGPVTRYDYARSFPAAGASKAEILAWRRQMNKDLLAVFLDSHKTRPVDWVFAYVNGFHVLADTVRSIRSYGVPTVNLSLDDKNSWDCGEFGGQNGGSLGLVSAFNLWWTSASVTTSWVEAEGGRAVYLPEGCNVEDGVEQAPVMDLGATFIGTAYGHRSEMVRFLRRRGVAVRTFGKGWGHVPSKDEAQQIIRRSVVCLGHGGIGYSHVITNVKGRDFELPALRGGAYVTTYNADLARHFEIGREIFCWHSLDELLEVTRFLLRNPAESRLLAARAYERCRQDHRWGSRYLAVLRALGFELQPIDSAAGTWLAG
jgi:hypothetical protein